MEICLCLPHYLSSAQDLSAQLCMGTAGSVDSPTEDCLSLQCPSSGQGAIFWVPFPPWALGTECVVLPEREPGERGQTGRKEVIYGSEETQEPSMTLTQS